VGIYFAVSWALLPLIPVAVLPEKIGRGILFAAGLFPFAYAGHALGAKRAALTLFLLSPKVSHGLLKSNIEWLPFMGVILPPQVGVFFVTIKPQSDLGGWLAT
jgi:hypothetical protein